MRELVKSQPVVILPIGSVEDHGPHLPIDTDNFLIWSICEAAAQSAPGEILLMPQIPFGFETHHMDFPGTIDIHSDLSVAKDRLSSSFGHEHYEYCVHYVILAVPFGMG
jgi:creatinine amidohydrolase/Fe(II)-dependent formamide hydrolase-like protein